MERDRPETLEGMQTVKRNYFFRHLTRAEKEFLVGVLMEELQIQSWYAVGWSDLLGGETFLMLQ
jgi:hypothetical protein